ncbi:MAG: hypothetical protein Q9161_002884 [Pseudevernia consocians]
MPVNWKDPDAFTRLLAAMVAAQDMKLDYRKIASMYGNGATYDSIEGRFRIIKKDATALKAEVDSGDRPGAPARGAVSVKATTPKKIKSTISTPKKGKTLGGRVNKSNATPTKKRDYAMKGIKEEPDSNFSSFTDDGATADAEDEGASANNVDGGENKLYDDNDDYVYDGMDFEAF